jgi:HAD superfamily hydrolase (TIGR01509 family)
MHPYQVLFFDLDHTLIDTRRQYDLGLAKAIEELYQGKVPETFIERFFYHHERLWELYDKREITMHQLRRQRFLRAWQDFGITKSEEEADLFQETYNRTFEDTLFAYPGTIDMLETLSKRYRMGIVTNGSPDLQWRKMEITGLTRFFTESVVIISERVGLAKPHPSVYQAACDALQVRPKDAVMIGDNYRVDVLGARAFGMDAIWYVPDDRMVSTEGKERALRTPQQLVEQIAQMEQARRV